MTKVLIAKLGSLGDLVHALPALSDASQAIPGIEFEWIVDRNFSEIPLWNPSVTRVLQTNHRQWRKKVFSSQTFQEAIPLYKDLRSQTYDLIIDAQGGLKSALISLIPHGKRAGWDSSSVPEWGAHFLYSMQSKAFPQQHAIDKIRALFADSLAYPLPSTFPDYGIDRSKFISPSFDLPKKYLIFVPLASYPSKLWPEDHWKSLLQKAVDAGYPVLLPWASAAEKARAERLATHPQILVLPRLSLNIIGFLIAKAHAMVCVDTGLSHIAAALGTPAITLYGPTDPRLTGTIGKNQHWISSSFQCPSSCKKKCKLPQGPCCLRTISPEKVFEELSTLL